MVCNFRLQQLGYLFFVKIIAEMKAFIAVKFLKFIEILGLEYISNPQPLHNVGLQPPNLLPGAMPLGA